MSQESWIWLYSAIPRLQNLTVEVQQTQNQADFYQTVTMTQDNMLKNAAIGQAL